MRAWKAEHPGAAVVAYVNTSAEVKAEADVCCTSANAAEIVAALPEDREVLFLPDQFLGAHVRRITGRDNIQVWLGECHVHAGISPDDLRGKAAAEPDAELFIHPECGCSNGRAVAGGPGDLPAGRTRVLSTGGMLAAAREDHGAHGAGGHRDRHAAPAAPGQPGGALGTGEPRKRCARYMKMNTPATLLRCLRDGVTEVGGRPGRGRAGPAGRGGHDRGRAPSRRRSGRMSGADGCVTWRADRRRPWSGGRSAGGEDAVVVVVGSARPG